VSDTIEVHVEGEVVVKFVYDAFNNLSFTFFDLLLRFQAVPRREFLVDQLLDFGVNFFEVWLVVD
jgi:hypothetical protein